MLAEHLEQLRQENNLDNEMTISVVFPDGEGGLIVVMFRSFKEVKEWMREAPGTVH